MKNINPVNIWMLGKTVTASILNAYVINDDLTANAYFYFALYDSNMNKLQEGNLAMQGQDYINYLTNADAYSWVANKLDLTIISDYVPTK